MADANFADRVKQIIAEQLGINIEILNEQVEKLQTVDQVINYVSDRIKRREGRQNANVR